MCVDHFLSDIILLFTDACDSVICSHGDADGSPDKWPPYGNYDICYNAYDILCKHAARWISRTISEPKSNVHFKDTVLLHWMHPLLIVFCAVVCFEQDGKVRRPRGLSEDCASLCPAGESACLVVIFLRAFYVWHVASLSLNSIPVLCGERERSAFLSPHFPVLRMWSEQEIAQEISGYLLSFSSSFFLLPFSAFLFLSWWEMVRSETQASTTSFIRMPLPV